MRRLLIALAISLLPSLAFAHGHGGGGQVAVATSVVVAHMGSGWSGGRIGGAGLNSRAAVGVARVGNWNGARWNGASWNHGAFRHGRFVHRHGRVFFVGGGPWWVTGYDNCWQWVPPRGDCVASGPVTTTNYKSRGRPLARSGLQITDVRFGSKADIRSAKRPCPLYPREADMCSALTHAALCQ